MTKGDEMEGNSNDLPNNNQQDKSGKNNEIVHDEIMPPILDFVDEGVIGGDTNFEGPFGERKGMFPYKSLEHNSDWICHQELKNVWEDLEIFS